MKTFLVNHSLFTQNVIFTAFSTFFKFFYETKKRREEKEKSWNEAINEKRSQLNPKLKLNDNGALPIIGAREFHGANTC